MIQVCIFLLFCPLAGFSFSEISWIPLLTIIFLTTFGLNSLGFFLAWWLNSLQGYHAIMSVVLIPLWLISGAMFPLKGAATWLHYLMMINPMAYCVEGIRFALYGGIIPKGLGLIFNSFSLYITVDLIFCGFMFFLAVKKCQSLS